ncbi:hypothetical protein L9F63_011006, partial [Diploptera punctata]
VLSDPLSQVLHAWYKIAPVHRRKSVLLLGGGITAHLMASVLHVQGYINVTIIEKNHNRRSYLSKLVPGFTVVEPNEIERKRMHDEYWGIDIVIDCDGEINAINEAMKFLLPGGTLLLMKSTPENDSISLSPYKIYLKELKIIGSLMNPYNFMETLSWLETLGERYLDFKKMNIHIFGIKDYKEALREYKNGNIIKAVFKMDTSGSSKYFQRKMKKEIKDKIGDNSNVKNAEDVIGEIITQGIEEQGEMHNDNITENDLGNIGEDEIKSIVENIMSGNDEEKGES